MATPETFPQDYFATEVKVPRGEVAPDPQSGRASHETDETVSTGQDDGPRLVQSSAQVQGKAPSDRREDLPRAKPSTIDKIFGKLEKTAGEYWNSPYLIEKGELRRSGVFAARRVQTRA